MLHLKTHMSDKFKYVPKPNFFGTDSFKWDGSDGDLYSDSPANASIEITDDGPDRPTVSDFSKNGTEDTALSFSMNDFNDHYNDLDADDSIEKVLITTLPQHGTLQVNGAQVTEINASDLNKLKYVPDEDFNSTDTFKWKGSDETGYSANEATVTLNIAAADDKPTVSEITKEGIEDTPVVFTQNDFVSKFNDHNEGELLTQVIIKSLPGNGILTLNSAQVNDEQSIDAAQLDNLVYTPAQDFNGEDTFDWTARDAAQYAENEAKVIITINNTDNPLPPIESFLQYNINVTKGTPGVDKMIITLDDQFELRDFVVSKPMHLYNPVEKNGVAISDSDSHFVSYSIKLFPKSCLNIPGVPEDKRLMACRTELDCGGENRITKYCIKSPKSKKVRYIKVDNDDFGTIFVDTKLPDLLLVPSSKCIDNCDPLPDVPGDIDHFKCYKISPKKGMCEGALSIKCKKDEDCGSFGPCHTRCSSFFCLTFA